MFVKNHTPVNYTTLLLYIVIPVGTGLFLIIAVLVSLKMYVLPYRYVNITLPVKHVFVWRDIGKQ